RDRQNHWAPPISLAPRTTHPRVQSLRAHGRRSRISSEPCGLRRGYLSTAAREKTRRFAPSLRTLGIGGRQRNRARHRRRRRAHVSRRKKAERRPARKNDRRRDGGRLPRREESL